MISHRHDTRANVKIHWEMIQSGQLTITEYHKCLARGGMLRQKTMAETGMSRGMLRTRAFTMSCLMFYSLTFRTNTNINPNDIRENWLLDKLKKCGMNIDEHPHQQS